MPIALSGTDSASCKELATLLGNQASLVQLSADEVLDADFEAQNFDRLVWVYRTPWETLQRHTGDMRSCGRGLAHWLDQHRALMRRRRAIGKRLIVVNADHVNVGALAQLLGINDVPKALVRPARDVWSPVLKKAFEWAAPEYTDVEETLDALAQANGDLHLTDDAEKIRSDIPVRLAQIFKEARIASARVLSLEQELNAAIQTADSAKNQLTRLDEVRNVEISKLNNEIKKLQEHNAGLEKQIERQCSEAENLRKKSSTQFEKEFARATRDREEALMQLRQARNELEEYRANINAKIDLAEKSAREKESRWADDREKSEREIKFLQENLVAAQNRLEAEIERGGAAIRHQQEAMAEKNSELEEIIVHLHNVQEELESYYFSKQNFIKVAEQGVETTRIAARLLCELLKKSSATV